MSDIERAMQPTGHVQEVPGNFHGRTLPEYDPRSGEHCWIWVVSYRAKPELISDPTHTPILDAENLLSVDGPGCLFCEQVYTPRLAHRRCTGESR